MKLLVIVAHGSRVKTSNDEIINLTKKLNSECKDKNLKIIPAFLELCEPSIYDAIKNQINNGYNQIKVFPYFLAEGKHVKQDIPQEIENLKKEFKKVDIELLPHLGNYKEIVSLILSIV